MAVVVGRADGTPTGRQPVSPSLEKRIRRVDMLLLDVDGVLTDGRIIFDESGREVKAFHVRDGAGLKLWRTAGKRAGLITGRSSPIVAKRAAELGLDVVVQGAQAKLAAFRAVLRDVGLAEEQVCYVGDDVPDLPVLRACGLAIAVADACAEVVAQAHYVTRKPGGHGAVREIIELILRTQGSWNEVVERMMRDSASVAA